MLLRNRLTRDARVLREARSLAAAGHRVTVVALRGAGLPDQEERDGFLVVRAVDPGPFPGPTIASEGSAGPGGDAPGVLRRLARPPAVRARDALLARRFTDAARRIEADVFHAHDLNTLEPAARAAQEEGTQLVYDAHELYSELTGLGRGERARWARLERRLISRADLVIAPSESRADWLARRYGIARPLVVMNVPPLGPAPDPGASPLARLRRPRETLLVYAGGFTPNRGLENLVRATASVGDGVRLAMVGWGPLEASLRALAAGSAGRVEFVPPVAPDDVVSVASGADVGIAPYIAIGVNNTLAAPNKLFEYLHAGLAVAASDLPDIRQVVERHRVGALFDAADPASIAAALRMLSSSRDRLAEMRARARAAAPLYSWEGQERALSEAYARLAR